MFADQPADREPRLEQAQLRRLEALRLLLTAQLERQVQPIEYAHPT